MATAVQKRESSVELSNNDATDESYTESSADESCEPFPWRRERDRKVLMHHVICMAIYNHHGGYTVPHIAKLIVQFIWNDKWILHRELAEYRLEICRRRYGIAAFEENQ